MTQNEVFSKQLNYFIERSGKQQKDVAFDLGVAPTTFNTWCKGKILPRVSRIQKIAEYFHIPVNCLLQEVEPSGVPPLPPDETSLLNNYRNLNNLGKEKVTEYVRDLSENDRYKKEPSPEGMVS